MVKEGIKIILDKSNNPTKELIELSNKRLNLKKSRMRNLLKIAFPDEALYREIMLSLGYKNNKPQFLELALITPYSEIRKLKDREKIQLALLHRAGFIDAEGKLENFDYSLKMDKKVWNMKKVRPANQPQNRINQVSYLLYETVIEDGIFNFFKSRIEKNYFSEWKNDFKTNQRVANKIVKEITNFSGIGQERKVEMFFNIILPFFLVIYEDEQNYKMVKFLENLYHYHRPPSPNSIIKTMLKKLNIEKLNSVKEYMGVIQFYYEMKGGNDEKE